MIITAEFLCDIRIHPVQEERSTRAHLMRQIAVRTVSLLLLKDQHTAVHQTVDFGSTALFWASFGLVSGPAYRINVGDCVDHVEKYVKCADPSVSFQLDVLFS